MGTSQRLSSSSSSLANALKEHPDRREQMYQSSDEMYRSSRLVWNPSYEPVPQAQASAISMEPSTYSTVSTSHWTGSMLAYNVPPVEATQHPPSLVVTNPEGNSGYGEPIRHAQSYTTQGFGLELSPQTTVFPSSGSLGPLEYLLQDSNITPSYSTEGSPSSSFSGSPRSDIEPGSPWSVQGSSNVGDVVYSVPQLFHSPSPVSPTTSTWGTTAPSQNTRSDQWLDPRPSYSYQSGSTEPLSMLASQGSSSNPTRRTRTSVSPPPNTSGQEWTFKERTRRKRRIDPSIIRSARFISSPLSVPPHLQGVSSKRGPKKPELDHIHITNIPCPNADCSAPTAVDDSEEGVVENFACTYIDPANGRQCTSDFRRRGCRERHSGSHSGREAQDVTSGRISIGCARRILWETIRLIEASDWGVVYSPPIPSNQLMEVDWAQSYEEAGKWIAAEFDVDVLRQQAQAVKEALYELGRQEEQLNPDQKRISPVELQQYQQFVRLASKRAASFERFYCTHPNCDADFTRADALARHCRTCHEKDKGKKGRMKRHSVDGDVLA
ncbi:hypothetical protein FRC04_011526 [Tulasnella sp. 424]|nr:hypothetical protein FRC04_011526 [Tulasnella sp. 424]